MSSININIPVRFGKSREEKNREKDAQSPALKDNPDLQDFVRRGRMTVAQAINQAEERSKANAKSEAADADAKVRELTEKTIQLAGVRAGSSDPTAPRQNLDLPQFKAMPGVAPAPKVPGGQEIPDQNMVSRFESKQSAYPSSTKEEQTRMIRGEEFSDNEGARVQGGRAISDAEARGRIEDLQKRTQGLVSTYNLKPEVAGAVVRDDITSTQAGIKAPEQPKPEPTPKPSKPLVSTEKVQTIYQKHFENLKKAVPEGAPIDEDRIHQQAMANTAKEVDRLTEVSGGGNYDAIVADLEAQIQDAIEELQRLKSQ